MTLGAAAYFIIMWMLRVPELAALFAGVMRRLRP
jgi:hypothetical protein